MSAYESISLMENLVITEIYSIHYFEYTKDFVYEGESHDFWELLCVDNGVIEVTAGDQNLVLEKGEMIFHKPNEFHALRANGQIAPNLLSWSDSHRSKENILYTFEQSVYMQTRTLSTHCIRK